MGVHKETYGGAERNCFMCSNTGLGWTQTLLNNFSLRYFLFTIHFSLKCVGCRLQILV